MSEFQVKKWKLQDKWHGVTKRGAQFGNKNALKTVRGVGAPEREKMAEDIGATIILCNISKEECNRRLNAEESSRYHKDEYVNYIGRWFERHVP